MGWPYLPLRQAFNTTETIPRPALSMPSAADRIDFGDDTSEWAKDGECDDPRFEGTAFAAELVDADADEGCHRLQGRL